MIDRKELKKTWDLFVCANGFTEVRILGKFQYSGYFKSFDNLCKQLEPYTEMDDEQIYFVMNQIKDDCYARPQCEKFVKSPKVTTKDDETILRKWLLCDFDPVRLPNISSSNEQFELAHKKAQEVYKFLKEQGFSDMVVAISGSGWHLLIPVNIPCNDETDAIIKDFYAYMGEKFSDDKVEYDVKVYNRSRITKLYSVVSKKGANIPSNPWRQSKIVYIPQVIMPTPIEKIKELADLVPKEEEVKPVQRRNLYRNTDRFDIEAWLSTYRIEYKKKQDGTSTKYEIKTCPWHDTHSVDNPYSSAIYQDADGKLTYTCAHSHCADKQWVDFRLFYEPNAYDRPVYQPQQYQPRPYAPQKPKYEIKKETPELGKKWLKMSEIEKVDLSAIPRFKTGIAELDRLILGLAEGEITLFSGGNASGKSSFINTLALNAIDQGVPTAIYSGELPPHILKAWIQMAAAGRNNLKPSRYGDGKFYVPNNIGARIDQWLDDKLYLFNNEYGNTFEEVMHDMEELLELGFKFFVLDNLMSLDIDLLEGDKNGKQKNAILQLKDFAKKNKVHILLVAHPRKSMAFLRKNDISGTSDLTNAVDNVWICHRVNQDFLKAGAEFFGQGEIMRYQGFGNVISIEKNRMYGVCDVLVGLHYEIESRRFKNTEYEDIHYGWEAAPEQMSYWNEPEHYEVYAEGQPEMPFAEYQGDDAPPF